MTDQTAARSTPSCQRYSDAVVDSTTRVRHWRQLIFPAVFLIYLFQTGAGVLKHSSGFGVVVGMALIVGYCACYLGAMVTGRNEHSPKMFWWLYVGMLATTALEAVFAHGDAFVMLIYTSVLTVAALWYRGIVVIVFYAAISILVPMWLWNDDTGGQTAVAIGIISLAMYGFFAVIRSNAALAQARSEVARLATENERARIARDLHDLLGHSLTTISVKAQLARRLSEVDPDRATVEIAEVEALTRRTLADVRAAVSGYREVTLGNELAAAREVLRAAGITAQLPGAIDAVAQPDDELFAWVVREGVTNVVRHSRAKSCRVVLGRRSIEISDDGVGAQLGAVGNGLTGLRERVTAAGGRLELGPSEGSRGWRVRVQLEAAA